MRIKKIAILVRIKSKWDVRYCRNRRVRKIYLEDKKLIQIY